MLLLLLLLPFWKQAPYPLCRCTMMQKPCCLLDLTILLVCAELAVLLLLRL